jgi:hypothetical protein
MGREQLLKMLNTVGACFLLLCAVDGRAADECLSVPRTLNRMAQADQDLRHQLDGVANVDKTITAKMRQLDQRNTRSLKQIVDRCGWPTAQRFDERTALAAWLIIQHADHDVAFQEKILAILRQLHAQGLCTPRQLAYLSDRVEYNKRRKQIYGSQLTVTAGGLVLEESEIDSIAAVNERRAAIGLGTIEDSLREANAYQASAAKQKPGDGTAPDKR